MVVANVSALGGRGGRVGGGRVNARLEAAPRSPPSRAGDRLASGIAPGDM